MKASASKFGLLRQCTFWAREDVEWPKEKPSKAAALGTAVHAHIARTVSMGAIPEFDTDDWIVRRYMSARQFTKVLTVANAEVAFAMTDAGTRELGSLVARYAYPSDAFCGTADLIHHDAEGWHLKDWKTGSPSDAEEWQLRALAAMSYEAGTTIKTGKAVYLTDGAPRFSGDYLEGTDPVEDAKEIRRRLAMIPGSEPTPGAHCKSMWCPIRKICGAVNS